MAGGQGHSSLIQGNAGNGNCFANDGDHAVNGFACGITLDGQGIDILCGNRNGVLIKVAAVEDIAVDSAGKSDIDAGNSLEIGNIVAAQSDGVHVVAESSDGTVGIGVDSNIVCTDTDSSKRVVLNVVGDAAGQIGVHIVEDRVSGAVLDIQSAEAADVGIGDSGSGLHESDDTIAGLACVNDRVSDGDCSAVLGTADGQRLGICVIGRVLIGNQSDVIQNQVNGHTGIHAALNGLDGAVFDGGIGINLKGLLACCGDGVAIQIEGDGGTDLLLCGQGHIVQQSDSLAVGGSGNGLSQSDVLSCTDGGFADVSDSVGALAGHDIAISQISGGIENESTTGDGDGVFGNLVGSIAVDVGQFAARDDNGLGHGLVLAAG